MNWQLNLGLFTLVLAISGCSDPFAVEQQSISKKCIEKFDFTAMRNWAKRVTGGQSAGVVTLAYGVDLPFDEPKRLENALAQLPGDSQVLSFDGQGSSHVVISGMRVPFEYAVSASTDGETNVAERILIGESICKAVGSVGGSLTDVSVHTTGYSFDDGKLYLSPIP